MRTALKKAIATMMAISLGLLTPVTFNNARTSAGIAELTVSGDNLKTVSYQSASKKQSEVVDSTTTSTQTSVSTETTTSDASKSASTTTKSPTTSATTKTSVTNPTSNSEPETSTSVSLSQSTTATTTVKNATVSTSTTVTSAEEASSTTSTATEEFIIYGDVCKDGKLNVFDLCLAKRQLLYPDQDVIDKSICDLDGNGIFDINDIIELQDFILAKRVTFTRSEIEPIPFGSATTTSESTTTTSETTTSTTSTTTTATTTTETTTSTTTETTTEIQYHYFHGNDMPSSCTANWPTDDPDWAKTYDFDSYFATKSGSKHPSLIDFYLVENLYLICVDRMYGTIGFHEVCASDTLIKYENDIGDTITLTPAVDPDYPDDPNQLTSRIEWSYHDGDNIVTEAWVNSGFITLAHIYYRDNLTTAESGFGMYIHFLMTVDIANRYLPDGYTLPDGTFVPPEKYSSCYYTIDEIHKETDNRTT